MFFFVLPLLMVLLLTCRRYTMAVGKTTKWPVTVRYTHTAVTRGGNGACAGVLTWFDGDVYLGQFSKGEFHG